jgi:hypothetical protein
MNRWTMDQDGQSQVSVVVFKSSKEEFIQIGNPHRPLPRGGSGSGGGEMTCYFIRGARSQGVSRTTYVSTIAHTNINS